MNSNYLTAPIIFLIGTLFYLYILAGTDTRLGREERQVGTGHYEAIWLYLGCNWLNIEAEPHSAIFYTILHKKVANINIHVSSSPPANNLLPSE